MKKVVIIGPESTGKSTLSRQLAERFRTAWCPEYARAYLLEHGTEYTYDQLLDIAKGQVELEDRMLPSAGNGHYFIDTNLYVMKIWCEVAFENCHTWILKQIARRSYDLYLLCDVDLPWQSDELREYPDLAFRKKLLAMYKDVLVNSGTPWALISGSDNERIEKAVSFVNEPAQHLQASNIAT
jgi:NadR type nicotinamide-nucleotide adenylyltransferase